MINKNENFFEKIDSEDKAYFLGLMYADGTNSSKTKFKNSSKGKQFAIGLQIEDIDLLELFAKKLGTGLNVRILNKSEENSN